MQFLQNIAYSYLFGIPILGLLGILSYLLLWSTALVMILSRRKIAKIKAKVHFRLAYITIIVATIHAILAIAAAM